MQTGLRGRDLISLSDWTDEEVQTALDVAFDLKRKRALGEPHPYLRDRVLAMLFFYSSTRTRASFEAGMAQLGGHAGAAVPDADAHVVAHPLDVDPELAARRHGVERVDEEVHDHLVDPLRVVEDRLVPVEAPVHRHVLQPVAEDGEDGLDLPVEFKEGRLVDVPAPVRLRITLKNALLFAVWAAD